MSDSSNSSKISTIIHHPKTQAAGKFVVLSMALKGFARTLDEGPWKGADFTHNAVQHLIDLFNKSSVLKENMPTVEAKHFTQLDGFYVPQIVGITAGLYALTWAGKKLAKKFGSKEQDASQQR